MDSEDIEKHIEEARRLTNSGQYIRAEELCLSLLEGKVEGELRLKLLLLLAEAGMRLGKFKEAIRIAQEVFDRAEESGAELYAGRALTDIGIAYRLLSDYDQALGYYFRGLERYIIAEDKERIATAYSNIANVYLLKGDYQEAAVYYDQALELNLDIDNEEDMAIILGNMGVLYEQIGDYSKSIEVLRRVLLLNEKLGRTVGQAKNLINIGNLYVSLEDYDRAIEYYMQALDLSSVLDDKERAATIFGNLGVAYHHKLEYDKAIVTFTKALNVSLERDDHYGTATNRSNLGWSYLHTGEYDKALVELENALQINKKIGNKKGVVFNLSRLGRLFFEPGYSRFNLAKAEQYFQEAIVLAAEINSLPELRDAHKYLSDLYKQLEDWQKSLEHFEKFHAIKDSLRTEETQQIATKFDIERREFERKQEAAIQRAQMEAMQDILYKSFPDPIVPLLIEKEATFVEYFDNISVLFADIVGFTELTLRVQPTALLELLNFVFTHFDTLIQEAGGHRLRTIGDGYFAICGAPDVVEHHQYKLAIGALHILEEMALPDYVRKYLPENTTLQVRIGLHCGPAICGMVGGLRKWQYDAYGDTINTASRMESYGEPGKIHCSEEYKKYIENYPQFKFIKREPLHIKGKGTMQTYFLAEH